jgi:hypothetical protein
MQAEPPSRVGAKMDEFSFLKVTAGPGKIESFERISPQLPTIAQKGTSRKRV